MANSNKPRFSLRETIGRMIESNLKKNAIKVILLLADYITTIFTFANMYLIKTMNGAPFDWTGFLISLFGVTQAVLATLIAYTFGSGKDVEKLQLEIKEKDLIIGFMRNEEEYRVILSAMKGEAYPALRSTYNWYLANETLKKAIKPVDDNLPIRMRNITKNKPKKVEEIDEIDESEIDETEIEEDEIT